jgi:Bacteriophage HK97-gp10, putative tail-component
MFKFIVTRLPFLGDRLKAGMDAVGAEAAEKAAEYMADRMRYYVPVDTRKLLLSIKVIPTQSRMRWNAVATADHARHVEFGTEHHTANVSYIIPPNPFARRALADTKKMYPKIMKDVWISKKGQLLGATIQAKK